MTSRRPLSACMIILAAIFTLGWVKAASADVATLDDFAVTRDGVTIFSDSFGAGLTLAGGNPPGAILPSGMNFSNSTTGANYFVIGTVTETGNTAILNTAHGAPANFGTGPFNFNNVDLQTGPPTSPFSLTPNDAFTTTSLFNLTVPSNVGGFYQAELSTAVPSNNGSGMGYDVISVDVCSAALCGSATVPSIQLVDANFATGAITTLATVPLDTSNQQILFELSHPTAGTPDVFGSYAYVNGGVEGPLTSLGDYTGLFQGLNYAQPGFTQLALTPEPSSLMLLASSIPGVLGLAWLRRTRAARSRPKIGTRT